MIPVPSYQSDFNSFDQLLYWLLSQSQLLFFMSVACAPYPLTIVLCCFYFFSLSPLHPSCVPPSLPLVLPLSSLLWPFSRRLPVRSYVLGGCAVAPRCSPLIYPVGLFLLIPCLHIACAPTNPPPPSCERSTPLLFPTSIQRPSFMAPLPSFLIYTKSIRYSVRISVEKFCALQSASRNIITRAPIFYDVFLYTQTSV